MKNLLSCLLLGTATLALYADEECCPEEKNYLFELTSGYRQDQIKIHVTPATTDAFVASTNNWTDVSLFQVRGTLKAETCFNTYSRAYFNYGRLVDFHHDFVSPTLILDPSATHHKKGRVYDAEYAFGFSLYSDDGLRLTPITGYSYHRQQLNSHHYIPLATPTDPAGEQHHSSVVSEQKTTWRAPFVGMEMEFLLTPSTRIFLNGQYLWAHYTNQGYDFEKYFQVYSYKQSANGYGTIFYGEIGHAFLEGWEILLTGGYQYWSAKNGRDLTTYTGPVTTETKSHLDKVSWQSYEISLGLAYEF